MMSNDPREVTAARAELDRLAAAINDWKRQANDCRDELAEARRERDELLAKFTELASELERLRETFSDGSLEEIVIENADG